MKCHTWPGTICSGGNRTCWCKSESILLSLTSITTWPGVATSQINAISSKYSICSSLVWIRISLFFSFSLNSYSFPLTVWEDVWHSHNHSDVMKVGVMESFKDYVWKTKEKLSVPSTVALTGLGCLLYADTRSLNGSTWMEICIWQCFANEMGGKKSQFCCGLYCFFSRQQKALWKWKQ